MTLAVGLRSGRTYEPSEIDDKDAYDQMIKEPLIDSDGEGTPVVPVRRKDAPHFRRLGIAKKIVDLPRNKDTERHDQTIMELVTLLNDPKRSFELYTHVFSEDKPPVIKEQIMLCSRKGIEVRWFSENKIRFDDFTCIQPDISARDILRMSPIGASPAIIIEVIDTHYPEPRTFERLMALSRAAHHVYFYILGDGDLNKAQKLNSFTTSQNVRARFTFALLNGELVRNSTIVDLGIADPSIKTDTSDKSAAQVLISTEN